MSVRDGAYRGWSGDLREGGRTATIARRTFSTLTSFKRTKLLVLACWIAPIVFAVMVLVEYALRRSGVGAVVAAAAPSSIGPIAWVNISFIAVALLLAASAPGIVADDRRWRAFGFYFAKPIRRLDYAAGKFLGLAALASLVSILPGALLAGLRLALYAGGEHAADVAVQGALGLLATIAATLTACALLIGLSSVIERAIYVALAWLGTLIVSLIVAGIVAASTAQSEWAALCSLSGSVHLLASALLDPEQSEIAAWIPAGALALLAAAGLYALWWRTGDLEGLA